MEREKLSSAILKIAWGYIFFHVHINLGTMDVLPSWAGYCLILSALPEIGKEEASANLLLPLCRILIGLSLVGWINTSAMAGRVPMDFVVVVESAISIYFNFQLFTDLSSIAKKYGCKLEKSLLNVRTADALFVTFMTVATLFEEVEYMEFILYAMIFIGLTITIIKCMVLFSMRRELNRNILQRNEVDV